MTRGPGRFASLRKAGASGLAVLLVAAALLPGGIGVAADGDPCDLAADSGAGDGREINGLCFPIAAAAGANKCENAGWLVFSATAFGIKTLSCQIPIRNQALGESERDAGGCSIYIGSATANVPYPCADAFGPGLRFPKSDDSGEQHFIYNCPDAGPAFMVPDPNYASGGVQNCVSANAEGICAALFGGDPEPAPPPDSAEVCSAIDINDTFCIVGSADAFPCLGFFRHVWACNQLDRKALDPWHCAGKCAPGRRAQGAKCVSD